MCSMLMLSHSLSQSFNKILNLEVKLCRERLSIRWSEQKSFLLLLSCTWFFSFTIGCTNFVFIMYTKFGVSKLYINVKYRCEASTYIANYPVYTFKIFFLESHFHHITFWFKMYFSAYQVKPKIQCPDFLTFLQLYSFLLCLFRSQVSACF